LDGVVVGATGGVHVHAGAVGVAAGPGTRDRSATSGVGERGADEQQREQNGDKSASPERRFWRGGRAARRVSAQRPYGATCGATPGAT
jgi:hypothetical protein